MHFWNIYFAILHMLEPQRKRFIFSKPKTLNKHVVQDLKYRKMIWGCTDVLASFPVNYLQYKENRSRATIRVISAQMGHSLGMFQTDHIRLKVFAEIIILYLLYHNRILNALGTAEAEQVLWKIVAVLWEAFRILYSQIWKIGCIFDFMDWHRIMTFQQDVYILKSWLWDVWKVQPGKV